MRQQGTQVAARSRGPVIHHPDARISLGAGLDNVHETPDRLSAFSHLLRVEGINGDRGGQNQASPTNHGGVLKGETGRSSLSSLWTRPARPCRSGYRPARPTTPSAFSQTNVGVPRRTKAFSGGHVPCELNGSLWSCCREWTCHLVAPGFNHLGGRHTQEAFCSNCATAFVLVIQH